MVCGLGSSLHEVDIRTRAVYHIRGVVSCGWCTGRCLLEAEKDKYFKEVGGGMVANEFALYNFLQL